MIFKYIISYIRGSMQENLTGRAHYSNATSIKELVRDINTVVVSEIVMST
jgi:hypothetical protein